MSIRPLVLRRSDPPPAIEPIFRLPTTWSTAVHGKLSVNHFEGEVTVAEMESIRTIGDRWYVRYPEKSLSLSIVYPTQHRPTPEQRDALRKLIKHWEQRHLAAANVMLIDGLLGAMHRSELTGILMLAPPPHPAAASAVLASGLLVSAAGGILLGRGVRGLRERRSLARDLRLLPFVMPDPANGVPLSVFESVSGRFG